MEKIFEDSNSLDCFTVLNKGVWALDHFNKYFLKKEYLLNKELNHYTYWPPYSRDLEKKVNPGNYKEGVFGEIQEESFEKTGLALVIDDEIETGLTLSFIEKFLNLKRYKNGEIFVFGKNGQFGTIDIRPLSYYSKELIF